MSKTFVSFENVDIDIRNVNYIERIEKYSVKESRTIFYIIINNPDRINLETSFIPYYKFPYYSESDRDISYQELKDKLEDLGIEFN